MSVDSVRLARVAIDAVESFDDTRRCTCDDPEELGTCWYHLTTDERAQERIRYVAEAIEAEQSDG